MSNPKHCFQTKLSIQRTVESRVEEMDKYAIMLSLYQGRDINYPAFEKHFIPNDAGNENQFIYEGLDECDFVIYTVYVDIAEEKVASVEVYKSEDLYNGHGRPVSVSKGPTSAEWKHIFQILDECFPDQSADEVKQVIDNALASKCGYGGYAIKRALKNDVEFTSPSDVPVKLSRKRIAQAVGFSHTDVSLLRRPESAREFSACFSKAPFEPLFAILSTVDPSTYENYEALNSRYRYEELLNAIENSNYDRVVELTDVLEKEGCDVSRIASEVERADNAEIINWFFENVPDGGCVLNDLLYYAIKLNQRGIINGILEKHLYDPDDSSWRWHSPMQAALERHEYIFPLLERGFHLVIAIKDGNYFETLTWDQVNNLLNYNVSVSPETLRRILEEKRFDILEIIEDDPDRYSSRADLLNVYIEADDFERFQRGVEKGWASSASDFVFKKAYAHSEAWATLMIENGFDVNQNKGVLLYCACTDLEADFAIYLLKHGADPYVNSKDSTPILATAAGFHGYLDEEKKLQQERICRCMLDMGVDPIMESKRFSEIFSYMMNMSTEFKLYLIDWLAARGEINYYECQNNRDISAKTLLDVAERNRDKAIIALLKKHGAKRAEELVKDTNL